MAVDQEEFSDRILADAIAAPLRDPAAYTRGSVFAEWTMTERYLRRRAAVHRKALFASDADVEIAIDQAVVKWRTLCSNCDNSYRVTTAISFAARHLLHPSGREMILRLSRNDAGREILRWRFISLTLPPSILIAAASEKDSVPAEAVRLLDSSIAPDGPVAELHVHHAAMLSFEEVWASVHYAMIVNPETIVKNLREKHAPCPGLHADKCPAGRSTNFRSLIENAKHIKQWADLLRQAFIARYILSQHSWHKDAKLKDCGTCNRTPWASTLRYFVRGHTRPYNQALTALPWPHYRLILQRRWGLVNRSAVNKDEGGTSDALRLEVAEERAFLNRALSHIQCGSNNVFDLDFETLLMQYLRVKTAVFGLLVHEPGKHGLEQFLRHFSQIKVYAPNAETLRPQPRTEPGLLVAATEYRVATDAWISHRRWGNTPVERYKIQTQPSESAWLIHLKREAPRDDLPLFGNVVRKLEVDGDKIARAIKSQPKLLKSLRGLDIAGVETVQPLWVSAETLRSVRKRSQETASRNMQPRVLPLRLTLHVGEDFTWLTSGIRSVAEPIEWNLLLRGDRLGHAIAITIDPSKWWKHKIGRVLPRKRFERLLDLAFLANYTKSRTSDEEAWLASEMKVIVSEIWGEPEEQVADAALVQQVTNLWKILGTKTMRVLMNRRDYPNSIPHKWLSQYLWSRSTQARAEERFNVKVEESPESSLVILARRRVIHELARRQICIESNPSSNLLVAGLEAMAAQNLLHRRPTMSEEQGGHETLTWTISTDDPITFSTTLSDEYAYAWAGMVLRNDEKCSPSYARALLDEAAATSMRMRFTVPD